MSTCCARDGVAASTTKRTNKVLTIMERSPREVHEAPTAGLILHSYACRCEELTLAGAMRFAGGANVLTRVGANSLTLVGAFARASVSAIAPMRSAPGGAVGHTLLRCLVHVFRGHQHDGL